MQQINRYKHREAIEDVLNPLNGYRGKLQAQGKEVKDHIMQNRFALKNAEQKFVEKQEVSKKSQKEMTKTSTD